MTALELAERDLRKAHLAHTRACAKPNAPIDEIAHTLELVVLRKQIVEIIRRAENGQEITG